MAHVGFDLAIQQVDSLPGRAGGDKGYPVTWPSGIFPGLITYLQAPGEGALDYSHAPPLEEGSPLVLLALLGEPVVLLLGPLSSPPGCVIHVVRKVVPGCGASEGSLASTSFSFEAKLL